MLTTAPASGQTARRQRCPSMGGRKRLVDFSYAATFDSRRLLCKRSSIVLVRSFEMLHHTLGFRIKVCILRILFTSTYKMRALAPHRLVPTRSMASSPLLHARFSIALSYFWRR